MRSRYPKGIDRSTGCVSTNFNPNELVLQYNEEYLSKLKNGEMITRNDAKMGYTNSAGDALVLKRLTYAIKLEKIKQENEKNEMNERNGGNVVETVG